MNDFQTTRFGRIPVDPEKILHFPEGLPGFPQACRFYLLETGDPNIFYWLQSLDDPSLAFVVMDPDNLVTGYRERVKASLNDPFFQGRDILSLVIVTMLSADSMTANLQGPLVVRMPDRSGRQMVLFEEEDWLRFPLLEEQENR
ncbi:MAG: flagellar assembly protein FliW [Nitrospirae bacterium]|nr:flagellar assembly protein FliW [Nitrospirota bacterium]